MWCILGCVKEVTNKRLHTIDETNVSFLKYVEYKISSVKLLAQKVLVIWENNV